MKSLILKDLYTLTHNLKSSVFILAILATAMIPSTGPLGFVGSVTMIFVMMTITSFAFDDNSRWNKYALILPMSRRTVVAGKYVLMVILGALGATVSTCIGAAGSVIIGSMNLTPGSVLELAGGAFLVLQVMLMMGGATLPLIYRFGVERGRIMILLSSLFTGGFLYVCFLLLSFLGIDFSGDMELASVLCSPLISGSWCYGFYLISCKVFEAMELS